MFPSMVTIRIKGSATFHIADDTCLLSIKQSIKEINKSVNKDLISFLHWLNTNKSFLMLLKLK